MKRTLHILLIATCLLPLLSSAREETLEERRQRIMRKYLRERTTILQSDSLVPEESPEDLQVLDSERFKGAEIDLKRQEPGAAMPLPPQRPRPLPAAEDRNWLLAEDPLMNSSLSSDEDKKSAADWATWNTDRETSSSEKTESRFDRRNYDTSNQQSSRIYDTKRQGILNPRAPLPFFSDGFQQQESSFGRESGRSDRTPSTISGLDLSRDPSQNPNFIPGRLYSPVSKNTESSNIRSFGSDSQQRSGSSSYTSPFRSQRNQQTQQQGTYGTHQQEFQKQDPYQKWKEQNPTRFDPTRDDAFIDDVMPNSHH